MSILTYKHLYMAAGLVFLSGCQLSDIAGLTGASAEGPGVVQESAELRGGVIVAGPSGYCVDGASGKRGFTQAGLVLASCVRLKDQEAFDPTFGHLLTAASVGDAANDLPGLAAFLRSDDGAAILASNADAGTIVIHEIITSKSAVYVDYSDSGRPEHLGQRSWKAFLNVADKLIVLSVYQGVGEPVAGGHGETVARDFAAEILRQNVPAT